MRRPLLANFRHDHNGLGRGPMRPCKPCVHPASLRYYMRGDFMHILYYSRTSGYDGSSRNYRPSNRHSTDAFNAVCAPFKIRQGIRLIKQAVKQHKKTAQQKLRRFLFNAKQIILRPSHQRQALDTAVIFKFSYFLSGHSLKPVFFAATGICLSLSSKYFLWSGSINAFHSAPEAHSLFIFLI